MTHKCNSTTRVGEMIRRARTNAGLSQLNLALQVGLKSDSQIWRVEMGKEALSARHLWRMAKALKIPSKRLISAWLSDLELRFGKEGA